MNKNIAVVMGGYSGEHDISIGSGTEVYKALNKEKHTTLQMPVPLS